MTRGTWRQKFCAPCAEQFRKTLSADIFTTGKQYFTSRNLLSPRPPVPAPVAMLAVWADGRQSSLRQRPVRGLRLQLRLGKKFRVLPHKKRQIPESVKNPVRGADCPVFRPAVFFVLRSKMLKIRQTCFPAPSQQPKIQKKKLSIYKYITFSFFCIR